MDIFRGPSLCLLRWGFLPSVREMATLSLCWGRKQLGLIWHHHADMNEEGNPTLGKNRDLLCCVVRGAPRLTDCVTPMAPVHPWTVSAAGCWPCLTSVGHSLAGVDGEAGHKGPSFSCLQRPTHREHIISASQLLGTHFLYQS